MALTIVFRLVMIIVYLGLGIYIIVVPAHFLSMSGSAKSVFGLIIFLYGGFRIYDLVKKYKENSNGEDEK